MTLGIIHVKFLFGRRRTEKNGRNFVGMNMNKDTRFTFRISSQLKKDLAAIAAQGVRSVESPDL